MTVVTGVDNALNGLNTTAQYVNQLLPDVYGDGTYTRWLNPAAFAAPATGTIGTMRPGTVRGPGSVVVNAAVTRLFRVREKQTLEFRTEAQNVLNHTNFGDPVVNRSNSNFGRILSAGNARIMQFSLKYAF